MGLFNNYTKPGPGVSKDAPKKKGIFLYLELFWRKFSKLISLNILYFICSLPMTILYFVITLLVMPNLFNNILDISQIGQENLVIMEMILSLFLSLFFTITLGSGPASAAMAYVMREFSRENHVWLFSTFFEKMKENFKQEIVVAVVDLVFLFVASFGLIFYFNQYLLTGSMLWFFLLVLMMIFSFIIISMHYYIHQLIVTFENKLKDIYKNAFLFAMSTVLKNILLTAFIIAILYFVCNFLHPVVVLIISLFLLVSFLRFPVEFFSQDTIKKLIKYETEETVTDDEIVEPDLHRSEK